MRRPKPQAAHAGSGFGGCAHIAGDVKARSAGRTPQAAQADQVGHGRVIGLAGRAASSVGIRFVGSLQFFRRPLQVRDRPFGHDPQHRQIAAGSRNSLTWPRPGLDDQKKITAQSTRIGETGVHSGIVRAGRSSSGQHARGNVSQCITTFNSAASLAPALMICSRCRASRAFW